MNEKNSSATQASPNRWVTLVACLFTAVMSLLTIMITITRHDGSSEAKVNPEWEGWEQERYRFGMDKNVTPQPTEINSPLISAGTVMVSGDTDKLRWGFHVFEGYAKDGKSRITMLVNKHEEEGRPLAELYYYGTAYSHHDESYNWFKIGSDVKEHSFMFSRDKAISFGLHDFRNVIELAAISPGEDIDTRYSTVAEIDSVFDPEAKAHENARCLLYIALKEARDGAMWYNKDTHRIVCKVNGKWQNVATEDAHLDFLNK